MGSPDRLLGAEVSANLPGRESVWASEVLVREIAEQLEVAMGEFAAIAEALDSQ